ncbi:MAG TPA: SOS response-associated peptidase [Rariglobus sp.]|jgi:putative SOS response-associated peptidase YedK|nr:SOS response-associated peptidase [Rariglobus sp.]
MCCRYVILQEHTKSVLAQLGVLLENDALPASRYNLSPGAGIPVVRNQPDANHRELAYLHWGLVPSWARDADNPSVNARAESLAEKPSFRDAFRARRCLIPASGFYEWAVHGHTRKPWLFRLRDESPFALAGLWETWRSPDGDVLESCAVVTTAPNTVMQPVHHRMPAMLNGLAAWEAWLDPHVPDTATLGILLQPFPSDAMTALAVSPHVNNVRHDGPSCLSPATEEAQLGLDL